MRTNENIIGTLETGEKYYVYRFVLYSDDFGPRSTLFPKGSVGGVYLRPVDIPINILRSPQCIHPVSLAPTGVNSNVIINDVIKDVVFCSFNGFDSLDANGQPCRIFLHLLGYVGDYPESSAVVDIMKHSARSPCTLCNFRYKRTEFGPSYTTSTSTVSLNSSFTRGWFRTKAVRYSGLTKNEFKWLGMNDGDFDTMLASTDNNWVLLKLADSFDQYSMDGNIAALTVDKTPVVPCRFDPYIQNMIAPDHCVTGIVKSTLQVCFEELSPQQRLILDSALVAAITKMGITGQSSLFNLKSNTLNGASMSTLFAIISILPSVLSACGFAEKLDCFKVANSFSSLVCLMYWWPSRNDGDLESFNYVHHSPQYHLDLQDRVLVFIDHLRTYYEKSEKRAAMIDSPNVHRLLELVLSTIPTFGHCLLLAELPFEAFHQSLKKTLSKNTTTKAHLTAMKCVLFSDWFRRVSTAMH